mmetsp:Transcript_10297/g.14399  ORF Transcript_10297/g.14399 Transcript_10297/m.14399 type:complete len:306 (-) Transcript_10297:131-1048(-)|eukprot:CAMPEP_0185734950 /NCGR_PEP_ID=MMETSP1171-20130828/23983_1 /TAXON_ID=374046 /ORGANISM="Helicotheca tamensis, Strain CCMP826" /LENGTH=305 /DNA_ID=CAMNT_0028405101 /DNA_START=87 /DNA_END=1004 /DNA_ORIENTATION=-
MVTFSKSTVMDYLSTKEVVNTRHDAPIPLFPREDLKSDSESSKVCLELKRPAAAGGGTYEKEFNSFNGTTTEEYCKFRMMWDEIVRNVPLRTPADKFAQIDSLVAGNPKMYWDAAVNSIPAAIAETDAGFDHAMDVFSRNFCESDARSVQRQFMNCSLGRPYNMSMTEFFSRLLFMDRCIPYLPGVGARFPEYQLKEIIMANTPNWVNDILCTTSYDWADPAKTHMEVVQHLERLLRIQRQAEQKRKKRNPKKGKKVTKATRTLKREKTRRLVPTKDAVSFLKPSGIVRININPNLKVLASGVLY